MVYTGGIGMQKNILLSIFFSFIVISTLCSIGIAPPIIQPVAANPATIYVPDTYDTIQKAVDAANPYDIIIVRTGIYRENIFINKTLTLIGKDRNTTIIDGSRVGDVIHVISSNVVIINFTIQNSTNDPIVLYSGISLWGAVHTIIRNNILKNNSVGIHLQHGSNNSLVIDNLIVDNMRPGIRLADNSSSNCIIGNTLKNNTVGVEVHSSSFNSFHHNNFIRNKVYQARPLGGVSNTWENNYWSDYEGEDTNGDGIGDTKLPIWVDDHPLMEPWSGSAMRVFIVELGEDPIIIESNCTIMSFDFNRSLRQIRFRITGPSVIDFFCNVSVPKTLLEAASSENWLVQLNNTDISAKSTIIENANTIIYFSYELDNYEVRISITKTENVNLTPYAIGFGAAIATISIMTIVMLKKKRRS
jgi:parallel beta-helix repeat protein